MDTQRAIDSLIEWMQSPEGRASVERQLNEQLIAHHTRRARMWRALTWWAVAWLGVWLPIAAYVLTQGVPFHGFWFVECALLVVQYGGAWAMSRFVR